MGQAHKAEPTDHFQNSLKDIRVGHGLSQTELAAKSGITRQAVSAIESHLYFPTTSVALRLAAALRCRVEDLFSLAEAHNIIEGKLIGSLPQHNEKISGIRVKVARVGTRMVVRPVTELGEMLSYAVPADGYAVDLQGQTSGAMVRVNLSRDPQAIEQEISIAGCDPAVFLAGEYLRRYKDTATVVGWTMGSGAALDALKRRDVHVAGLHIVDEKTGESNLPYLRKHLRGDQYCIITFAAWEEGLLIRQGNPKGIRTVEDIARKDVTFINREERTGARNLLDQKIREVGILPKQITGYERIVGSHLEVARLVAIGQADVGIGVRSAARVLGLSFVPLQEARYDFVIPTAYMTDHPSLSTFMDTIVSRQFRNEIEALGGYNTRDTGKHQIL
jgi:molybdopterin molybdotransferase/putative molybdopterin biosynthesis protein